MANQNTLFNEVLKDFSTVQEGKTLFLQCKINRTDATGKWYKDNNLIISCDRIKISSDGMWQMLEIRSVTKEDGGIYYFVVKTTPNDNYTKTIVTVQRGNCNNVTRYFPEPLGEGVRVNFNLRNCNSAEGSTFVLHTEFSNVESCTWYKNDDVVPTKRSRYLIEENGVTKSRLFFDNSEISDTGIYVVVAKTYDSKYLCSYADVLVTKDYSKSLFNNEKIPHFWQCPVDCTEVYDKDDVILIFKASYDIHTIIKWTKDENEVKVSDRITRETYNNNYLALKLCDVTCADSGTYFLHLRHRDSMQSISSSAVLTVKKYRQPRPTPCSVNKELLPTIASVGDGVTFRCSFHANINIKYTYVAWIVGQHKIEKSTNNFLIICGGSEYILHIPVVTPEMAGEVTCQLRQHVPPQQSILLSKSTSHLAVLPSRVIEEQDLGHMIIKENHVYCNGKLTLRINGMNCGRYGTTSCYHEVILQFNFCKTSTSHFFFEVLNEDDEAFVQSIKVSQKENTDMNNQNSKGDWNISWFRRNKHEWYFIDVYKTNGQYAEIGISSTPSFDIKEPPEDKLFKFRIRTLTPQGEKKTEKYLMFVPDEISLRDTSMDKALLPFKEYKKTYYTDIKIGQGGFGTVNIVRRHGGELFTAKSTKYREQYQRAQAIREFDIMKKLAHPNTIAMIDGFHMKNRSGVIFTMEYSWGGELIERTIDRHNLMEIDLITYIRQILLALEYIHSLKIIHLDLRPENIVCVNRNSRIIKIIDFGMAKYLEDVDPFPMMYGAKDFVSPEILNSEDIGTSCDMWSLGVLTYWLLTGHVPFTGLSWIETSSKISRVDYCFDDKQLRVISDYAKEFVSRLLRRPPRDRMTATTALKSDWISIGPGEERSTKKPLRIRGGLKFVEAETYIQIQWKVLIFVVQLVMKFRANRRQKPAKQPLKRRTSARIAARRQKLGRPSTSCH